MHALNVMQRQAALVYNVNGTIAQYLLNKQRIYITSPYHYFVVLDA